MSFVILVAIALAATQSEVTIDAVETERAANEKAYDELYLVLKERLFGRAAGAWVAIAGGEVLPQNEQGWVVPAASLEDAVAAAEKAHPRARHRFVFRVGEDGPVRHKASGVFERGPTNYSGVSLHDRLNVSISLEGHELYWRRGGRTARFRRSRSLHMPMTLSDPSGAREATIEIVDGTGFTGFLGLDPATASKLGTERFEIPGRAVLRPGVGTPPEVECRRAYVRVQVPEIGVDDAVPAIVWIEPSATAQPEDPPRRR